MSDTTHISWCDSTWNPWRGCTKVSAGCANCYAEKLVTTRMRGKWGKGAPRVRAAKATFNAPLRWNKKPRVCDQCGTAYRIYLRCNCGSLMDTHRRRVFFGSLMDWLDPEVPVEWLADALDIVRRCEGLDFLMLTKRPQLFQRRLIDVCNWRKATGEGGQPEEFYYWLERWLDDDPPGNVWVGASVEDQRRADERVPELIKVPAAVRFLSVEPLLEPVDLLKLCPNCDGSGGVDSGGVDFSGRAISVPCPGHTVPVDWVIVGGESGPNRRDCGAEAIVDVVRQCQAAGVPVFVKQGCSSRPGQQGRIPDDVWSLKKFPVDPCRDSSIMRVR